MGRAARPADRQVALHHICRQCVVVVVAVVVAVDAGDVVRPAPRLVNATEPTVEVRGLAVRDGAGLDPL